jgi:hypothetical protein
MQLIVVAADRFKRWGPLKRLSSRQNCSRLVYVDVFESEWTLSPTVG